MEKKINEPNALVHWEDKVLWYVKKKCLYSTPGGFTQKINFFKYETFLFSLAFSVLPALVAKGSDSINNPQNVYRKCK